jgi:hypothetical protein
MMKRDKIELKKVLNPYSELVKSQCIFTDNVETTSKINTIKLNQTRRKNVKSINAIKSMVGRE